MTTPDDARIIAACRTSADALLVYARQIPKREAMHNRAFHTRWDAVNDHRVAVIIECNRPVPDMEWVVESVQNLYQAVMRYLDYAGKPEERARIILHCWSLLPRLEATP